MEGKALVLFESGVDFQVLVGGIVVEDHVHDRAGRHLALDRAKQADERLMAMLLQVAAN